MNTNDTDITDSISITTATIRMARLPEEPVKKPWPIWVIVSYWLFVAASVYLIFLGLTRKQ